jgi:hypothetical protein
VKRYNEVLHAPYDASLLRRAVYAAWDIKAKVAR